MLGLDSARRRKGALAIATAGTLIGLGLGIGPAAAADPHAEAEASAIRASGAGLGQLFGPVLDGGTCTAVWNGGAAATPSGSCGDGLTLGTPNSPIAYTQNASAGPPAHSTADATTAPVGLPGLNAIDLTNIIDGLQAADASDLIDGLAPAVGDALETALIALGLLGPLDDALNQITDALDDQLDVVIGVGATEAMCTADPGTASGNGTVTGVGGTVSLPTGDTIPLTITTGTAPNSKLVGSAADLAQQIYDDIAGRLQDETGPLAPVFAGLSDLLDESLRDGIEALLAGLDSALEPLGDGLEPLVEGTVNEQVNGAGQGGSDDFEGLTPPDDGEITVTALNAVLFQATPLEGRLELSRVNCGPNTDGNGTSTPPPPDPDDDDGDDDGGDDGDGDDDGDDDEPRVVDSGINDGGNLGALAITSLLAASTLVGSAARQRLLLDQ